MILEKKALLIGINYIGTKAELRGCINDIIHTKSMLINEYKYDPKNIITLTELSNNKKPTRNNIIQYINWLIKDNHENSRLFLHYSGHGSYTRDTNHDERDGRDETICPLDYQTGMIVDDDLRKMLVDPLVKGAKLTCLFDCCHSGTVLDLRCNYKIKVNDNRKKYIIDIDKHYKPSNGDVLLLSGCMDKQTSADAWEEGMSQGAMTYSLLKSIEHLKKRNKTVTIETLMRHLLKFIKQKGYSQIPQISTGKLIDFNQEFTIV